jgi:heme A synthase
MKITKIAIYAAALGVFVTALCLFFLDTIHGPMFPLGAGEENKAGAALGWVTAGTMVGLLIVFVFKMLFLAKKTKPETKLKLAPAYQWVNGLHRPLGALAIALLCLHFTMVFDVNDPSWVHFITGYVLVGLLLLIAALGFWAYFNKTPSRKKITLAHQIAVAALLVTFLVHLIVK